MFLFGIIEDMAEQKEILAPKTYIGTLSKFCILSGHELAYEAR